MKRILFALALLTPACFNVDERPCTFACGPNKECPDDYLCLGDGYCHLHGVMGPCGYSDLSAVESSVPDLTTADGNADAMSSDAGGANGAACSSPGQCGSGFCVDGVCCDSACASACKACKATLTGGTDGTCANATNGTTDPRAICAVTAASGCATDGKCTAGACESWPGSTVCGAATCSANMLTPARTCNGTGTCNAAGSATTCGGNLKCNGGGTACLAACGADGDCVSGFYCSNPGASGTCVAKGGAGAVCTAGTQCTLGFCVDGFCCNMACATACSGCSAALTGGANGTCASVINGTTDPRALCAVTAMSSCGTDGKCSGGACEDWPNTTICATPSCSGSSLTPARTCNGTGTCPAGTPAACMNGLICANATMCRGACGLDTDCASMSNFCSNPGVSGTCTAKLGNGIACTGNNQCTSSVCGTTGTGNCCVSMCTGGACGATGCNGSGACVYPTGTTSCGAPSCTGSTITPAGACNGSGGCTPGTPGPCAGSLACSNATMCIPPATGCGANSVAGDANCAAAHWCDGVGVGACQPPQATGGPCTRNSQCITTCNVGAGTCN